MAKYVWNASVFNGAPLYAATIATTVYVYNAAVDPPALVQIWDDIDGLDSKANPFTITAPGKIRFYANEGRYNIVVQNGGDSDIWEDELIGPTGIGGGGGGGGAAAVFGETVQRSTSYTLDYDDHNIFAETSGDLTVTIPASDLSRPDNEVYMHHIRHTGGGVVTIEGEEGVTVVPPDDGLLTMSEAGLTVTISQSTVDPLVYHIYGLTDPAEGGGGGGTGTVESVVAGTGIEVDSTDPANPVISATGGGGTSGGPFLVMSNIDELDTTSKELGELGGAGTLTGTQGLYLVDDDGQAVRLTLSQLKTFINTDPTVVPSSVPWRGCRVGLTSDFGVPDGSGFVSVTWGEATLDAENMWSPGAPTRLTVPTGVTKVRVSANLLWGSSSATMSVSLNKNGTAPVGGFYSSSTDTGSISNCSNAHSGIIEVTGGDYFELRAHQTSGAVKNILLATRTWFELEVVEATV